jgi:predicted nuclease of restriction endonuclease-like RecB superfamily
MNLAKSRDKTTQNYFADEDLEYGKISEKFDSSLGHHVKGIEDRVNQLREERNNCRSPDRRCEIMQQITSLEEDRKVLKDSIRTEIFLAHPDNIVAP